MRAHIGPPGYTQTWVELLSSLSSTLSLNIILASFMAHLSPIEDLDPSERTRSAVLSQALLLNGVFGRPTKDSADLWDAIRAVTLGRVWSVGHARVFSCWIAGARKDKHDVQGKQTADLVQYFT